MNGYPRSFAPRPLVFLVALGGTVAGAYCAPNAPPPVAPQAEPTVAAIASASAPPTPVAASSVGAVPPAASSAARPAAPIASSSASAPLPVPKVTVPAKPKPVEPAHGRESWAVFLVLGPKTPERDALADAWWAASKSLSRGIGCHEGPGAPGSEEMYVAAYFKTEKDAKAFAEGASPAPVRIAKLKTYCLD